jgi:hypothetical protein
MAVYSERLLAPVLARLEQQAEELGRVKNENEHLRARVAELEAPPLETQSAPQAVEPEGRPWWRRLLFA